MSERVVERVVQVATVVLALAGATLGANIFGDLDFVQKLIIVSCSGLLGIALTLLWVLAGKTPEPQPIPVPPPTPMRMPVTMPPPPASVPAPAPVPEANNAQWWNQSGKPAAVPAAAPPVTNSVPLTDFDAHRVQIAQCPRCAGFELDTRRDERGYAFECRNPHCRNRWEWLPGTAWPATVVRHNLTRAASAEGERR